MLLPWLIGIVAFVCGFAIAGVLLWRRLSTTRDESERLKVELAQSQASLQAEKEKTVWTDETRSQLRDAFKALASDELEAKSEQLKVTAKDELGGVVGPLKEELTKLDKHVRELEGKREGAYSKLGTQLTLLQTLQDSLKQQTTTLAEALRAPTVRGRWGEVQLRRLVELAGMEDHVDFVEQESGEVGRPDMTVRLPQGGILPIDSKVPLGDFLKAMETEDEQLRKQALLKHAQALRSRVRELSQKAYWDQFPKTPEVVVMFVPVEASLGAAFQHDSELFEYAIDNKVLVSSPVVLFALLKAVAFGWQQHQIAENARQIADQGKTLYDRILKFVEYLSGMGKSLESCVMKYNEAIGSLEGRLLPAARRFIEMGVTAKKIDSPKHVELQPRSPAPAREEDSETES
ncbi:MAG: DNA recombination protein RmuC [Syntrophobacterales bacterium]|jgi:DNA recombination protein RmuC